MSKTTSFLALVTLVTGAALVVASPSRAQYREFSGEVQKINKKQLIVDNRMGDKVSFNKVDDTTVEGEGKAEWGDVKKGDCVSVSWKFTDKPRKAYKVQAIPCKADAAEDLE